MNKNNKNLSKLLLLFKKFKIDLLSTKIKKINLFEVGMLDSFSFLELIIDIEKKFKIKFSDKEMYSKKNGNLDYILKLILKKLDKNVKNIQKI
jgi:acyl carrier protein